MEPKTIIDVVEFGLTDMADPTEATALAERVADGLDQGHVVLDVRGAAAITTAFGNLFFATLFSRCGADRVRQGLGFRTANEVQREVIRRSIRAALPR